MTLTELSQHAYAKYAARLADNGRPQPPWEALDAKQRSGWTFAVREVWNVVDDLWRERGDSLATPQATAAKDVSR